MQACLGNEIEWKRGATMTNQTKHMKHAEPVILTCGSQQTRGSLDQSWKLELSRCHGFLIVFLSHELWLHRAEEDQKAKHLNSIPPSFSPGFERFKEDCKSLANGALTSAPIGHISVTRDVTARPSYYDSAAQPKHPPICPGSSP